MLPNVIVYHVCFGKKDKYSNIGFIFRVEGFPDEVMVKIFSHEIGTIQMFFVLN